MFRGLVSHQNLRNGGLPLDVWRELHSLVKTSRNSRRYRHRRGYINVSSYVLILLTASCLFLSFLPRFTSLLLFHALSVQHSPVCVCARLRLCRLRLYAIRHDECMYVHVRNCHHRTYIPPWHVRLILRDLQYVCIHNALCNTTLFLFLSFSSAISSQ